MKLRLLTVGLAACLTFGLSYSEASAATELPSTCGNIPTNENPTFQQMNCLLTNAAIKAEIPPEVVKAVAAQENGGTWKQFDEYGEPIISSDGGIGLMQITNKPDLNQEKLKYDINYNIEEGIKILNSMYSRDDLPKIKEAGREVIENWYFPVMAYNGSKPINSPIDSSTKTKNTNAYQEGVFSYIEQRNFTTLGKYPFKLTDFTYDRTSTKNIIFNKKEYTLTDQMHTSSHLFLKGDTVFTNSQVNLRNSNGTTSAVVKELNKNALLTINGPFKYDTNNYSKNHFVWYPVTVKGSNLKGYISSAYITKAATVNAIDDNDKSISGTAPTKSIIKIMSGKYMIASSTATTSGKFKVNLTKPQKAKTKLTVTFKDRLNTPIPSVTLTVIDKTAPKKPTINPITKTSKIVKGKTEASATVQLRLGNKAFPSKKANKYGQFTFSIKPQKVGTNIYVTAADAAKNASTTRTKVR